MQLIQRLTQLTMKYSVSLTWKSSWGWVGDGRIT